MDDCFADTASTDWCDLSANFFLSEQDIGSNRAVAVESQLRTLNPVVKLSILQHDLTAADIIKLAGPGRPVAVAADASEAEATDSAAVLVICDGICDSSMHALNEVARGLGVSFVMASCMGLAGQIFVDFGDSFRIHDVTGEPAKTCIVEHISNDAEGLVTVATGLGVERMSLEDGDVISFSEVQGMLEINAGSASSPKFTVSLCGEATRKELRDVEKQVTDLAKVDPPTAEVTTQLGEFQKKKTTLAQRLALEKRQFKIGDTSQFSPYISGGVCTQCKVHQVLAFKSLKQSSEDLSELGCAPGGVIYPELFFEGKYTRWQELHALWQAVQLYRSQHSGQWPTSCTPEFDVLLASVDKDVEIPAQIKQTFLRGAPFVLSPIAAICGGLAGQEVLKACTRKWFPIYQWLIFDRFECAPPESVDAPLPAACNRYLAQETIFGPALQSALLSTKLFCVGAGALGCELLKNYAMMGIACGAGGKIIVTGTLSGYSCNTRILVRLCWMYSCTKFSILLVAWCWVYLLLDDDHIEASNLSRQFLYREEDINKSKSTTAAAAVKKFNPELKIQALEKRVSHETEDVFDATFWSSSNLDVVTNALDNVKARLYVDEQCVTYGKCLLESGTRGPLANTQVIIPGMTLNYGATKDAADTEIPFCTVKFFPHTIEHTISWARSEFEDVFSASPQAAATYLESRTALNSYKGMKLASHIQKIHQLLVDMRPKDMKDCVHFARILFENYFVNSMKQLLYTYPPDKKDEDGKA